MNMPPNICPAALKGRRASLLICLTAVVFPLAAQAAVITNLDDKPQTVEVEMSGGFKPVVIAAGETWRVQGKAVVRFRDRQVQMNEDEEYAIWKDGTFGPQKRE